MVCSAQSATLEWCDWLLCLWVQGCSESSVGVAAHPWTDVAVRCFGSSIHCNGLRLHPPKLPTGTHTHTQLTDVVFSV